MKDSEIVKDKDHPFKKKSIVLWSSKGMWTVIRFCKPSKKYPDLHPGNVWMVWDDIDLGQNYVDMRKK
jgi:hypothetical protein